MSTVTTTVTIFATTASASATAAGDPSAPPPPPAYHAVGITLAVCSGLFIGTSFVLKKVGLLKANVKYNEEAGEGYGYLKNAYWWTGMTLMIIGEICNFVAYAFVDAILVTPLGALSVVITTILSAIFLKERLSLVGKAGCFLSIVGSIIILLNAPPQASAGTIQKFQAYVVTPGFLTYAGVIIIGCICVAVFVAPKYAAKSMLVELTICSLIGGLSVVATQGLGAAVVTQARGVQQFNQWFLYVLFVFVIATLVTEIIYLNKALNRFNASLVTPTYYVYFTSSTIVASAILFQGFNGTAISITTIVLGFFVICTGVILLQLSKSAKDVPDSKVFTGDLDQMRTIAEQPQPESEPKADAVRGAAGLIRSLSKSRRKMEEDEAKRVRTDLLKDQMETISENEVVEWDGLRRRKTVLAPGETRATQSLRRKNTVHPPLGMASFTSENEQDRPTSSSQGGAFGFGFRRKSRGAQAGLNQHGVPEELHGRSGEDSVPGGPQPEGSIPMSHVYGLPSNLRTHSQDPTPSSTSISKVPARKPIHWAEDVEDHPHDSLREVPARSPNLSPAPPPANRRTFSFQNVFHRNKDPVSAGSHSHDGPLDPPDSRQSSKSFGAQHAKDGTEEERLGLVKGDSNLPAQRTADVSEESATSSTVSDLGGYEPVEPRRIGLSDAPSGGGGHGGGGGRGVIFDDYDDYDTTRQQTGAGAHYAGGLAGASAGLRSPGRQPPPILTLTPHGEDEEDEDDYFNVHTGARAGGQGPGPGFEPGHGRGGSQGSTGAASGRFL